MWCCVALVKIDVSEKRITSIMSVQGISNLGTLAVNSNWNTLRRNTRWFSAPSSWRRYLLPNRQSDKNYKASYPRRRHSSQSPLWKPQILQIKGSFLWMWLTLQKHIWFSSKLRFNSVVSVRFEDFTAATVKSAVFCDIKTQSAPHRRHLMSYYRAQPVNVM
jgi:hypothetical protein